MICGGDTLTSRNAGSLAAVDPAALLTVTEYTATSAMPALLMVSRRVAEPEMLPPSFKFAPFLDH